MFLCEEAEIGAGRIQKQLVRGLACVMYHIPGRAAMGGAPM